MVNLLQAVFVVVQLYAPTPQVVQHTSWHEPSQLPQHGVAKLYMPYKAVSEYRYQHGMPRCPECVGFAALLPAADLGRKIMVTANGITIGPLLVIDCVEQKHFTRRVRQGDLIEVDPSTWRKLALDQFGPTVTVSEYHPPRPLEALCRPLWPECPL